MKLASNEIDDKFIDIFYNYNHDEIVLKVLDLSNNLVMSNGAIRIASQLKSYLGQSLILLDLKKNKIGNTGCEGLCKSLWHNMKLIYLDLSYCELDDRALVHISQML